MYRQAAKQGDNKRQEGARGAAVRTGEPKEHQRETARATNRRRSTTPGSKAQAKQHAGRIKHDQREGQRSHLERSASRSGSRGRSRMLESGRKTWGGGT